MVKRFFSKTYLCLILLFLYLPILVLIVCSFNGSRSRIVWGGFSLKWYQSLFHNKAIISAFGTTILLAVLSALIASVIGLIASLGIDAMRNRQYEVTMFFTKIPMLNADIVTGIVLMLWLVRFMPLGFGSVLIAHIVFNVPYVVLCILPKLKQMDVSIYEAARDLGANGAKAFFKITLPNIFPAVVSGFFMAFTMSLDDFVITYFTKGAGVNTLSTMIYGELRKGIKPEMYALSTIIFLIVLIILIVMNVAGSKKEDENETKENY